MASFEELAKEKGISLTKKKIKTSKTNSAPLGKRRAWLNVDEDNESEEQHEKTSKKGSSSPKVNVEQPLNTCKQTTIISQPIKTMQNHTIGPNLTQKNTTDKVRKNYGNTTINTTDKVRKNYGNTTDEKRVNYGNTTAHTTDEKRKNYGNTTEKVRKNYGNIFDISLLSGHQKNVFSYLVDRAKFFGSQSINGDRLTPAIKASELAESVTGTDVKRTRDVIRALVDRSIIFREKAKHGPGGWTIYGINNEAYSKALVLENYGRTTEKVRKNYGNTTAHTTDRTTDISPSSSSSISQEEKTTTTKLPEILAEDLSIQWDLEVLKVHEGQLNQIASLLNSGRVSESLLRLSLSEVAFHKQNGGKFNKDAVSALFSALRTGHGFTSPIREEIELERKNQIEKELIKKAHAEQKRIDEEYQPWRNSLSEEKRLELIKELNGLDRTKEIQEVLLKTYFSKRVN